MSRGLMQGAGAMFLAACSATSAPGSRAAAAEGAPFKIAEVASFTSPWAMDFLPGGGSTALVTEREGKLWLIDVTSAKRQPVGGLPKVHVAGQGGLGDVVADPDYKRTHRIYLSFVEAGPNGTSGAALGYGRLVFTGPAVRGGPSQAALEGFRTIWRQRPKVSGDGHFSHRIAFGPDGFLYLSSGERQKFDPAQSFAGNLGKVLRLTKEGGPAPGNPWAKRMGFASEFWSIGHRNVLGLDFAPDGRLWASEMGPKGGDEINRIVPGRNYGWPAASNGSNYDGSDIPDHQRGDGFEPPRIWWTPSISPGGLLIYSGDLFKGWKGDALVPALSGKALIRIDIDGQRARKAEEWDMGARIRAADQGPDGAIYLLEDEGRLLELKPSAQTNAAGLIQ